MRRPAPGTPAHGYHTPAHLKPPRLWRCRRHRAAPAPLVGNPLVCLGAHSRRADPPARPAALACHALGSDRGNRRPIRSESGPTIRNTAAGMVSRPESGPGATAPDLPTDLRGGDRHGGVQVLHGRGAVLDVPAATAARWPISWRRVWPRRRCPLRVRRRVRCVSVRWCRDRAASRAGARGFPSGPDIGVHRRP